METIHDKPPQHPLLDVVASISEAFDKATTFNPIFVPTRDRAAAMRDLSTVITRAQGLLLSVMAVSGDVADEQGAKRVGDWYATATRHDHRPSIGLDHLARSLDTDHVHLQAAVLDGRVNLDQARVIVHALDELPIEFVTDDIRERAEVHLIALAEDFAPTQLRRLAHKVLEVIAPEISEEAERKALEREEQLAAEHTRLTLAPLGDGTTRIGGRISDAAAGRLRTYLEAFASPRRTASEHDGERVSTPRLLGLALTDLLESLPAQVLPAHGGTATTVTVRLDLDQLTAALERSGIATLDTGDTITASQARRLACQAKILPAVLGGKSEVLDLGRSRRLHSAAQRKALRIQQSQCQADGCSVPAAWCETHHPHAWSTGGKTDLDNAALLCCHHHHRAHDTRYLTQQLPNGDYRFSRRT
ncbi:MULTISPECIES: HNH endonuclease signature motif containing protein [Nocardioides]|uniref:HNH endonuclease signature motif containing protein n=1 Tax=Nocardioides TaxID=1839 RepID=UPI00032F2565|nr:MULTISPECIES: HNH endonuclease signature motif containing protein [Nocardioides]EON23111.1 HNH nuclease [Nocardioides sp. CF8]